MNGEQSRILDISWATILKISVTAGFFYLFYLLRDVLIWVVFALIISILFEPAINFLRRFIPRPLAVVFVYVAVFGVIGVSIYLIVPVFVSELNQYSKSSQTYFETISPFLRDLGIEAFENFEKFTQTIEEQISAISSSVFSAIGIIFGGIFSTMTILFISLFVSFEERGIERVIGVLTPKKYEAVVLNILEKSQKKVAGWFGTRILASLFIGLLTFFICKVLKVDYGVSFGLFSGVFNFIPIVGPIAAGGVIAVIIAADSWLKAGFFIAAFALIQMIEGNILTPVLTKRFIGLSPVLVLIALLIGGKLWGLMGALLAIPMAGIFFEFSRDFLKKRKEEKSVVI